MGCILEEEEEKRSVSRSEKNRERIGGQERKVQQREASLHSSYVSVQGDHDCETGRSPPLSRLQCLYMVPQPATVQN